MVRSFGDLRPISLSTFLNKVVSKVLQGRIDKVIYKIISSDQTGFMKEMSISENELLAQEIVKDINKKTRHVNVMVKLDMTKAYDRISWVFLTKIMRNFGFGENN